MRQRFFGELYPINILVTVLLVFFFTAFIKYFFPTVTPRTLEIERLLQ